MYLARDLSPTPTYGRTAEEADIETRWVDLDTAVTRRARKNPRRANAILATRRRPPPRRGWSRRRAGPVAAASERRR